MDGVILFADDHVFEEGRQENRLFKKFNSEINFSVLPINNLAMLEKAVASISTYRAVIVDWNFTRSTNSGDDDDLDIPDDNPYEFLKSKKIFSLIFIYSQTEIDATKKAELEDIYPGKIFFATKNLSGTEEEEYSRISTVIEDYERANQHLKTPFLWSQAINNSVQSIFNELEIADPNWIKEIYQTAMHDGAEPNVEVIGMFQYLLSEHIIQNEQLNASITELANAPAISVSNRDESLAKLFHRIYYTKIYDSAPLTTGDIINLDANKSAILITPECDIEKKKESGLDFLVVTKTSFTEYLRRSLNFTIGNIPTSNQQGKIEKIFNQEDIKIHILPSFPFEPEQLKSTALVDFQTSFILMTFSQITNADGRIVNRKFKLNSPFIHQLRQRYLSYTGRVGVPAIPPSLRDFNIR